MKRNRLLRRRQVSCALAVLCMASFREPLPGCQEPLAEEVLQSLDLEPGGFFGWVSYQPGEKAHVVLGVVDCCYFHNVVPACVEWSVEPAGAATFSADPAQEGAGTLEVLASAAHGTVIVLRADVESGRRVIENRLYVYTREGNPLVGTWEEVVQLPCLSFVRADSDQNGRLEVTDAVQVFGYQFLGTEAPRCLESADANGDGGIDISDGVSILNHLFLGGPAPPAPFPACGGTLRAAGDWCRSFDACPQDPETPPTDAIHELLFEADGTFSVTWYPFEVYRDYWGNYAFDPKTGVIGLTVEGGNYVPPDLRCRGCRVSVTGDGLSFQDLWLGSFRDGPQVLRCGHRFKRW